MVTENTPLVLEQHKSYYKNTLCPTDFSDSAVKLLMPDSESTKTDSTCTGLTLQQLQQYSQDPFWVRIRTICLFSLWFGFVSLLTCVIVLTVHAPRCKKLDWWQEGTIYNLVSDSTGLGHLKGVQEKLDYLSDVGVKTILLSPLSTQSFIEVDPQLGSIPHFQRLLQAVKQRGMKLIVDMVPNHSSDRHEWFNRSLLREAPFTDYYVWAAPSGYNAGAPLPPNNWVSVYGGSAWEWSAARKQFYLHQFHKHQPDLNYRCDAVLEEMLNVLKFWLQLGADGFYLESVGHLFESQSLFDEPLSNTSGSTLGDYNYLKHVHTLNLPEVQRVLSSFRHVLSDHSSSTDQEHRLLMVDVQGEQGEVNRAYGEEADISINTLFINNINNKSTADHVTTAIQTWFNQLPHNTWTGWQLGSRDVMPAATRFGSAMVDSLHMLTMLLPGTAVTFYGEEIGMQDNTGINRTSWEAARTPNNNTVFTDGETTWLPVNKDHLTENVEIQQQVVDSHLSVYKKLVRLRKEPSIMYGDLELQVLGTSVQAFTRILEGQLGYACAVNWGNETQIADLTAFRTIPHTAQVYTTSIRFQAGDMKYVDTRRIQLAAKEGIVVLFTPTSVALKEGDLGQ